VQKRDGRSKELDALLRDLAGMPLGLALDKVFSAADGRKNRESLRWGTKLLLVWSRQNDVDLGTLDEVALRAVYRPYLLSRFTQANLPMWAAHRVLEAIEAVRAETPGSFPPLPPRPPRKKDRVPRREYGTDLVRALPDGSATADAARDVIAGASSRVQAKTRRYAIGQFLTWCREADRDPSAITFEDIDGSFLPWARSRVKGWRELGVHARKLVRLIAAPHPEGQPLPHPRNNDEDNS